MTRKHKTVWGQKFLHLGYTQRITYTDIDVVKPI